jgi:hypothetical protein
MIKTILLTLAVALVLGVAGVLFFAMTKPDEFRVQRSTSVKAPPDKLFAMVNDFHNWTTWSPYEKRDPAMQRIHSGAASGKGAVYEWEGNGQVGKGRMEIMETAAPSKVAIKLDFIKPFEGHNTAEFTFVPKGDATEVTWRMFGPAPLVTKVMSVFINMDKMIGRDFEDGLRNLKAVAER